MLEEPADSLFTASTTAAAAQHTAVFIPGNSACIDYLSSAVSFSENIVFSLCWDERSVCELLSWLSLTATDASSNYTFFLTVKQTFRERKENCLSMIRLNWD